MAVTSLELARLLQLLQIKESEDIPVTEVSVMFAITLLSALVEMLVWLIAVMKFLRKVRQNAAFVQFLLRSRRSQWFLLITVQLLFVFQPEGKSYRLELWADAPH